MAKAAAVYAIVGALSLGAAVLSGPVQAQSCPHPSPLLPLPESGPARTLQLEAGKAFLDAYGISRLSDGVNLLYEGEFLQTESMSYDEATRRATIDSAVTYRNAESQIEASSALLDIDANQVRFVDTLFRFSNGGRGEASELTLSPSALDLRGVAYTTCDPASPAWAIRGSRITLDVERGEGTARNMQFRIANVPVLYLPWFRFPIDDRRKTGLLYPELGTSDQAGFTIREPLYLNLHPQADLTLAPEWLARRGLLLGGEARGLWSHGRAEVRTRWINRDDITDETRYEWGADVLAQLGSRALAELAFEDVSDVDFLRDLGRDRSDSQTNVLERRVELSWRPLLSLQLRARAVDFEVLDEQTRGTVPAREPEVLVQYRPLRAWHGWRPTVGLEATRFTAESDDATTRYDLLTKLDWEHLGRGWEVQASGSWRATRYDLEGQDMLERDLPSARIGLGLNFRRALSGGLVQTLRPRLDYLYTPYRDQDALPVFDTNLPDFSLDQLRTNNRFSGIDRVSDENTLIPSIESAILDPLSGIQRARLRVGLQYRLQESTVTLPGEEQGRDGASDWLIETDVDAANGIRGRAAAQYNTEQSQFDALSIGGRFIGHDQRRLQLAYRFRRELFEQVDALALWPLGSRWHGAFRWIWAVDERRNQETLFGLAYQSCCWGMTTGVRRYVNGVAGEYDSSVFLQLSFNGLGRFGRGFEQLLDRDALSF